MGHQAKKNESLPGSLDIIILRTLSLHDLRGYAILRFIQQSSDREILDEEGSLYPALQRLELNGWIEGAWGVTSDRRRARIYNITKAGRSRLGSLAFRTCNSHIEHVPVADLKSIKSCLLFGCVVTGVAFGTPSAHDVPPGGIAVDVCMEPTRDLLISTAQAESLASSIFSNIGVNLTWHSRLSDCDQPVRAAFKIRWAERSPSTLSAGALAAAHPFGSSETSITIYELPLQRFLREYANAPEVVLAYVLAHELAHVMQGLEHHSASGILKASWSTAEYYRMLSRTLTFTAPDVDLIREGLEAKMSNIASREGAPPDRSTPSSTRARAGVRLGFQE